MGDAAGIGPEIIVKVFAAGLPYPALVYGDAAILDAAIRKLGWSESLRIETVSGAELAVNRAGVIPVLNRWQALPADLPPGKPLESKRPLPSVALLIESRGDDVSTIQLNDAGVKSLFPALSSDITVKVCMPSFIKLGNTNGLVHATYLELSMLHSR